jgi:L-aspartate oxidase
MHVAVLCKGRLGSGSATDWAQGGIAAAMGSDDSPALHAMDTQRAGAGLSDERIVEILTRDAPARIDDLLELGAVFDRTASGKLALGLEGAHQRRRIVKAGGDATGHEILKTLMAAVRATPSIEIIEQATVDDLILSKSRRVIGVHGRIGGEAFAIYAPAVVLATGGIGRLYRYTTNPLSATGDGIAIAARAGAMLADMEFVQFHPTALAVGADPMPLVTEAVRGEGATLVNDLGERFMLGIHPDAECAPRDIVARAVFEQIRRGRVVTLDARSAIGNAFPERFPTVFKFCMEYGIDPRTQRIPIAPAAHYHMGGIAVDAWGRSSLPGLWACGEVSATGVHGANRLASNSLLEALVYGTRVATNIQNTAQNTERSPSAIPNAFTETNASPAAKTNEHIRSKSADAAQAVDDLRAVMYANVGLIRNARGLQEALARIAELEPIGEIERARGDDELRNLLIVGRLITEAALARRESRGSHYRSDYPATDEAFAKRSFTKLHVA